MGPIPLSLSPFVKQHLPYLDNPFIVADVEIFCLFLLGKPITGLSPWVILFLDRNTAGFIDLLGMPLWGLPTTNIFLKKHGDNFRGIQYRPWIQGVYPCRCKY